MAEPIPLSARLPRMKLESGGGGPHDPGMEARLAVLEEIAKSTKEVLGDIRVDLRGMREESRSELRGCDRFSRISSPAISSVSCRK